MIGDTPTSAAALGEDLPGIGGERLRAFLTPLLALLTALIVCGLLLLATGHNPFSVYQVLWRGAISGPSAFAETLVAATPLILLGLAVALGFKASLFNIGAEGQFIIGGVGAVWASHLFPSSPALVQAPLVLVIGAIAGALYAAFVGVLKVTRGTHEVITTIMLNYVAAFLVSWLVDDGGYLHGPNQIQQSYAVAFGSQLPNIWPGTRLHAGLLIALAAAVVVYIVVWRTTWGFSLRSVGLNPLAARSSGISNPSVTVWTMAASGGLAGLAGAVQICGLQYVLPDPFGGGLGFDAIAVAIIGLGNPFGIVLAALLLGGLSNAATTLELSAGISAPFVRVIEATILLFVAAPVVIRWTYFNWPRRLNLHRRLQ
jgi:ABC-type uncharacterized transport system permease subunit